MCVPICICICTRDSIVQLARARAHTRACVELGRKANKTCASFNGLERGRLEQQPLISRAVNRKIFSSFFFFFFYFPSSIPIESLYPRVRSCERDFTDVISIRRVVARIYNIINRMHIVALLSTNEFIGDTLFTYRISERIIT